MTGDRIGTDCKSVCLGNGWGKSITGHKSSLKFIGAMAEWLNAPVLINSSAMARNPIVESAKFGENP